MGEQGPQQPRRVLSTLDATCVVVGAIVGVGIFFTPKDVAILAGSSQVALLAWGVGGVIALLGALTFAELGGRYHGNGAQYDVLRDAYGPAPAFVFVFCNATWIQAGAVGIIGLICAQYLGRAVTGQAPEGWAALGLATALILGLVLANAMGVKWGARIQNLTVYAKVATLLGVAGAAMFVTGEGSMREALDPAPAREEGGGSATLLGLVFAALVPAFFSFGGWQQALWVAGEVRRPRRAVPPAIVGGVLIVVAVYMLANWAYFRLLGYGGVTGSTALAADAVASVWPGAGARVLAGAVAVSAFGVLNAQFLSGPRLVYGMARDGRFFSPFARLHGRYETPVAAIGLLGGLAIGLLLVLGQSGIAKLLTGVVFVDGVFFALTGAALLVLRARRRDMGWTGRYGSPVVPALFVLGETGIVIGAFLGGVGLAALIGVGWIAVGVGLYWFRFRESAKLPEGVPCPECGYDLRGLAKQSCPECGWPRRIQPRSAEA